MRRELKSSESEYLEAGEEPAHIVSTGRLGRNEVQELLVHYLGDVTVVEGHGPQICPSWAFDEIMEPQEVLNEFETHRWKR